MTAATRRRFLVKGHVQDVGFRAFALMNAERLGVIGWVRNLPDGRIVEVVAEADVHTLRTFEEQLRLGPPAADVQIVERVEADESEQLQGFEVRY